MVAQLKASCDRLTEEQLGKLGVVLFNCQADSEGRPTYRCTDKMVKYKMMISNIHMNNMERTTALQQRLNVCSLERFPTHLSDSKGVHTKHGYRHLECLSHNQQQGALCLLRNSPAAFQTQSRAHRQFTHHYGHKPTRDHEGPEGVNLLNFFFPPHN